MVSNHPESHQSNRTTAGCPAIAPPSKEGAGGEVMRGVGVYSNSCGKSWLSHHPHLHHPHTTATVTTCTTTTIPDLESNHGTTATATAGTSCNTSSSSLSSDRSVKLLFGAAGIYVSFLWVSSLQEDIFRYVAKDGLTMFDQAWLLQFLESILSTFIGLWGIFATTPASATTCCGEEDTGVAVSALLKPLPLRYFAWSGAAQVTAKACSNLSLAQGLPYPVMILAKSVKLAPIMVGSLIVGGASYHKRDYMQVLAIMGGTILVLRSCCDATTTTTTLNTSSNTTTTTNPLSQLAIFYILMSLAFDGAVAGFQKRLQRDTSRIGVQPSTWDFMFWMSIPMALLSGLISWCAGEMPTGLALLIQNPTLRNKVLGFALSSSIGQVFICYTLAHFDPLVLGTVTTTRKIVSVLISIFLKGHVLNPLGWMGVLVASFGILLELHPKQLQQHSSKPPRLHALDKAKSSFRSSSGY